MNLTKIRKYEEKNVSTKQLRKQLTGKEIHGFKFEGFAGHNTSMVWEHKNLGLTIYTTLGCENNNELQTLYISVDGINMLESVHSGNTQKIYDYEHQLTLEKYLELIKKYVKENLQKEV